MIDFSKFNNYCCPVNIFKSFINQYLSLYKPPLISSLTGSLMRIKLLGRRRQWFLGKGESLCKREQRANSFALCREQPNLREVKDCLSERSER